MTEVLTSTRNPRVRAAASLSRRRERRAAGRHLVEGPRAVAEALMAGVVDELFVTEAGPFGPLDRRAVEVPDAVRRTVVSDHVLAHLADATTPQGVVGVADTVSAPLGALAGTRLVVVLDRVADPGNVGTVVRTCDAAGVDAVVLTAGCADPYGPKAVRAAVGSTYHLPLVVDVDLSEAAGAVRAAGHRLLGLEARAPRSVFDLDPTDAPLTLVLGSEAHGLSDPDRLDGTLAIPLAGRAESLNAAAAAAIAVFTAARTLAGDPDR